MILIVVLGITYGGQGASGSASPTSTARPSPGSSSTRSRRPTRRGSRSGPTTPPPSSRTRSPRGLVDRRTDDRDGLRGRAPVGRPRAGRRTSRRRRRRPSPGGRRSSAPSRPSRRSSGRPASAPSRPVRRSRRPSRPPGRRPPTRRGSRSSSRRRPATAVDGRPGGFSIGAQSQLILFMFLTSLTGATELIVTRDLGISRRMFATPTRASVIIVGEGVGRLALALFQGAFIVVASTLLFGVEWGDPVAAIAIVVAFSFVAAGAAMLVGAVARNASQAGAIGPAARHGPRAPRRHDGAAGGLPGDDADARPPDAPRLGDGRLPGPHLRRGRPRRDPARARACSSASPWCCWAWRPTASGGPSPADPAAAMAGVALGERRCLSASPAARWAGAGSTPSTIGSEAASLAPGEDDERQGHHLDRRRDEVRGRVAVDVGDPAEERLRDDAAGRAHEGVERQHRRPLGGRDEAVDEGLAHRALDRERQAPHREQDQGDREARRQADDREQDDVERPCRGSGRRSGAGTGAGSAARGDRRRSGPRRPSPRPGRRRRTPSGRRTARAGRAASRRRRRCRRRRRTAPRASASAPAGCGSRHRWSRAGRSARPSPGWRRAGA